VRAAITFSVLLAILGIILFALFPPIGSGPSAHARVTAAQADIKDGIKSAIDQFKLDNGNYPKSLQDLVQQPADAKNWHGPYLDPPKLPVDPWGNKFFYEYPGKHNTNSYDLFSAGPDGKPGTDDDIGNWMN
jgi:general secretion pathway protein G